MTVLPPRRLIPVDALNPAGACTTDCGGRSERKDRRDEEDSDAVQPGPGQHVAGALNEINPAAAWVLGGPAVATRKFDGTCVMMDDGGNWWARREVKASKRAPDGFLPMEHDENTGKTMGWEPIYQSSFVKAWNEAWEGNRAAGGRIETGTYELCGPKVNGNPEGFPQHVLVRHGGAILHDVPLRFDELAEYLSEFPHEGIVWHHPVDGRMAKIKVRDFR